MKAEVVRAGELVKRFSPSVAEGKMLVVTSWGKPEAIVIPVSAFDNLPEDCRELLKRFIGEAFLATV